MNTSPQLNEAHVLASLPQPVLLVEACGAVSYVNTAAEQFLNIAAPVLRESKLQDILPEGNPLRTLMEQVLRDGISVSEYGVDFSSPRVTSQRIDIQVTPLSGSDKCVLATIQTQSMARKIDRQLTHRGAARSVVGMAAMMAHEIKNPLSGIKGAAQLIEQTASSDDQELTRLICQETDRITNLVDRMEVFSDLRPPARDEVNIHDVLDHVRRLAQSGFARLIDIEEQYDPSLPAVLGDRDQLIQVVLNLVKNAAEAVSGREGGKIILRTSYRQGVRMTVAGNSERVSLPLEVAIIDNGQGIPEDIKTYLFDPFVSTKINGSGLGLALVAKIIGDHGGVIENETENGKTIFRMLLPVQTNTQFED